VAADPSRRRLPVLQSAAPEDLEALRRPPWHWAVIGAGFVLTCWVPLAMLALWLGRALFRADTPAALLGVLGSWAMAGWIGGALVGRFGGRAGRREATLSGAGAALAAWGLALLGGGFGGWPITLQAATLVVLAATAAALARLGAGFGSRRRPGGGGAS
jgi:tRNA-(ms[2]io[6]A)-hydroxylase